MADLKGVGGTFAKRYQNLGGTVNSELVHVSDQALLPKDLALYKFLREVGNSLDMNIDGSVTPVPFRLKVPANKQFLVHAVTFKIIDLNARPTFFGGLGALTNGIKVEAIDADNSTVLFDYLDGETIKNNADFSLLAGVDNVIDEAGGPDAVTALWMPSAAGTAILLLEDQSLTVTVQDDLEGLNSFMIFARGLIFDKENPDFGC